MVTFFLFDQIQIFSYNKSIIGRMCLTLHLIQT